MKTLSLLALWIVVVSGSARAAALLDAGQTLQFELGPGATLELTLALPKGTPCSVEVVELGIDIEAALHDGEKVLRGFDGDLLRQGRHRIAVAQLVSDGARLSVRATRPGSPAGKIEVGLRVPGVADPADATSLALDLLETDTVQRMLDPGLVRQAESVQQARQLVAGRRAAGHARDLGRAYLMLDQILTRQFRYDEGIAALQESLPVFRAQHDLSAEASALSDIGLHYQLKGDGARAGAPFDQALARALEAHDQLLSALVKSNICNLWLSRGATANLVECTRTALAWSEATGDLARIATSWNNLGGAYSLTGQSRQAIAAYEKSVELRQESGVRPGPAQALGNIGLEYQALGRYDEAERQFQRAEAMARADRNERVLSVVLRHRGQLRALLGNYGDAGPLLEEASAVQRRIGQRDELIRTLTRLGEVERLRDGAAKVPNALLEALELAQADGNRRTLAEMFIRLAQAHIDGGRVGLAAPLARQALEHADAMADPSLQGMAHLLLARVALLQDQGAKAAATAHLAWKYLYSAGVLVRAADASGVEAEALTALGRPADALRLFERGVAEVERARAQIADPELRARFFATERRLHEGHVSALAELALARGGREAAVRALATSDRYRAQVLRELRAERRLDAPGGRDADGTLAALQEREASLSTKRWQLTETGAPAETRAAVERALAETTSQLAQRRGRLRAAAPRDARAELEQALAEAPRDVTLVEYLSGRRGGYAWTVSGGRVTLKRMPADAEIEALVAGAREAVLKQGGDADWADALARLCDAVWEPLRAEVRTTRVALVLDGALQGVPWAPLRCMDESGARAAFVDRYELLLMPALVPAPRDPRASATAAVLAVVDPIYDRSDQRLGAHARSSETAVASDALALRGRTLVRLAATHEEAQLLGRLVAPDRLTVLEGFGANRSDVTARLSQPARLVHFGTHGVVSGDDLAGSGLVLSLLDDQAEAREGFLSAREIARMDVPAELVVMAACESGHGAAIAGEGLQSLSYGFLAAGAQNVIAASWPVADAPTSRLMAEFYRGFLGQGKSAEESLRAAQRSMSRDPYWRHPRFWAGFSISSSGAPAAR